ncbi:TIGR03557 family F420-dependent LLM class oxidoreductase [Halosimplex halobium]|uniref:TIGR03557 family F420-dependent LLM class oxidoreductase n=1 Tax=Halosimplex halobium TaxID=3396618 RepID=UPI003F5429AE
MVEIGYALSSEEHPPDDLVDHAVAAEATGFEHALISDHYHPWVERQDEAPFAWSVLGAIARETDDLRVGTGVTCPFQRYHPAVVAQAGATVADMFDGRFFLGVGTGENLNEHVTGEGWPAFDVRAERLAESVEAIRELWTGEHVTYRGDHVTVEDAKLFTLPDETPPVFVSGTGPKSAAMAGEIGDGLVSTAPVGEFVDRFREGGEGPRYGQVTVCYADDAASARETAAEYWPNGASPGSINWELRTPKDIEGATERVDEDLIAEKVVCGPDADDHIEQIERFVGAGFDHVYVHQVGPDQSAFFEFYESEILPSFG